MKPLKYGINKVPGSGTIEMYPDQPIRIKLPQRPPISDILKSPDQDPQASLDAKKDALRSLINTSNIPNSNSFDQQSEPEDSESLLSTKQVKFKHLDDVRNQIMEKQKILDDMVDYAAQNHPGILEDLKNRTMDHYEDYLQMFPEHQKIQEELINLQDEYQNDPLHDEHFGDVLKKIRGNK